MLLVGKNQYHFIAFKTMISRYKMPVEFCTFFSAVCILDKWDVLEPARKSSGGHSFHFKCACVRCLHDDLMKAEPFSSILCFLS
jgi:hypothetical protein